jgi:hypothetical protein
VNVVRSNTSDDRFFMVAPGPEFPVGGAPENPATSLITPEPTLDLANYLIRGSYERKITPRFFWAARPCPLAQLRENAGTNPNQPPFHWRSVMRRPTP